MESEADQDSQTHLQQLAGVRAKLDSLVKGMHAADAELAALAREREQHGLLADACGALEKLRETGGAGLFWGDRDKAASDEQVRRASGRVAAFQKHIGGIEDRRQALIEQIRQHEFEAGLIEDDLFEAQEEEELRKLDWIIERELGELPARELIMPWTRRGEDDRRYRKSLAMSLLVCLLLAIVFPMIDLPLPKLDDVVELPDRVVRMMMKERPRPPAPPREVEPPKPEEQKLAQQPVEKPKPSKPVETDEMEPAVVEAAKPEPEQGILAFREKLASFQDSRVSDRIGLKPRVSSADETAAGRPQRAMLTSNAPGSSGGINLAALSRNAGSGGGAGGGMQGVKVGRATSSIAAIGGGGGDRPLARGGPGLSRTDEEIQIVFDRYKSAFYRLYNRELRKDPTLRGQLVLRLTIEPDGSVSMCLLQASDMDAPELSAQVVDRVRTINFGAKPEVQALTIVYPIDFLPAA
jgi:outer membrane biosynthesis protein TonB